MVSQPERADGVPGRHHELSDLPGTLDYGRLASITDALAAAVRRLAGPGRFERQAERLT